MATVLNDEHTEEALRDERLNGPPKKVTDILPPPLNINTHPLNTTNTNALSILTHHPYSNILYITYPVYTTRHSPSPPLNLYHTQLLPYSISPCFTPTFLYSYHALMLYQVYDFMGLKTLEEAEAELELEEDSLNQVSEPNNEMCCVVM